MKSPLLLLLRLLLLLIATVNADQIQAIPIQAINRNGSQILQAVAQETLADEAEVETHEAVLSQLVVTLQIDLSRAISQILLPPEILDHAGEIRSLPSQQMRQLKPRSHHKTDRRIQQIRSVDVTPQSLTQVSPILRLLQNNLANSMNRINPTNTASLSRKTI